MDIITAAPKAAVEWEFFDLPKQWEIGYTLPSGKKLTFNLKPFSFKHTGLFPEQAANWDWFSEKIRNAGRPVKVLNLVCLYGWCDIGSSGSRCYGYSCGCLQRNGGMGEGECEELRTGRCTDPLAGG